MKRNLRACRSPILVGAILLCHCTRPDPASSDAADPEQPNDGGASSACAPVDAATPPDASSVPVNPLAGLRYFDVRRAPYGAKGDGKTDDTAAFQRALDAAASQPGLTRSTDPGHGGLVFVPAGTYLLAGTLDIPSYVSLVGETTAPASTTAPWNPDVGTVLLSTANDGDAAGVPFLSLHAASTVEGLSIFYPHQTDTNPPVAYPWTIRGLHLPISLVNVTLVNSYLGVDVATVASGRHFIRGLYGQPLHTGIAIDRSLDTGRIEDVHFTPIWHSEKSSPVLAYTRSVGVGIQSSRADWEILRDIEIRGYATGILLTASACSGLCGPGNGQIRRVTLDTDVGIEARQTGPASYVVRDLTWSSSWKGPHGVALWHPPGQLASLAVSNADLRGPMTTGVLWQGEGTVSLEGGTVGAWASGSPALSFQAGRAVVEQTLFEKGSKAAIAVTGTARLVANANRLQGNTISGAAVGSNTP